MSFIVKKVFPVPMSIVCDINKILCDRDYMIVVYIPRTDWQICSFMLRHQGVFTDIQESTHKMHEITNDRSRRISDISRGMGSDNRSVYLKMK